MDLQIRKAENSAFRLSVATINVMGARPEVIFQTGLADLFTDFQYLMLTRVGGLGCSIVQMVFLFLLSVL